MGNIQQESSGRHTVRLPGELRLVEAAEIKAKLLAMLESQTSVVVDLTGVEGIDLACMQLLLSARRSFSRRGIELSLVDSPERVWAVSAAAAGISDFGEDCR